MTGDDDDADDLLKMGFHQVLAWKRKVLIIKQ